MDDAVDQGIDRLANRQHGNITRQQLTRLGLGNAAIAYRAQTRRLFRVHRGVFGVGRKPRTPLERAAAVVLACAGQRGAPAHEDPRQIPRRVTLPASQPGEMI